MVNSSSECPTFSSFETYLYSKVHILEAVHLNDKPAREANFFSDTRVRTVYPANQSSKITCFFCSQDRNTFSCPKFLKRSVNDRQKLRKEKNLCVNCLSPTHLLKTCKNANRCRHCGKPYHSLLHFESKGDGEANNQISSKKGNKKDEDTPARNQVSVRSSHLSATSTRPQLVLATALLCIKSATEGSVTGRALINPCSKTSVVSKSIVQILCLSR